MIARRALAFTAAVLVVLAPASSPAGAAARWGGYRSTVSHYAHTVCWFNPRYSRGQCAWVADRVLRASLRHRVDPRFVMSVIAVESRFNHAAVSRAGALGFGQLMPSTARGLGVDPTDPGENIDGTVRKLADLVRRFGRADLVAAAYNAGAGAVLRYRGIPPYRETREFVARVLWLYAHFLSHPAWTPEWS